MFGDPSFVILKHSTWLDTSRYETQILGSIIRHPLKPTNDFLPSKPLQYNAFELVESSEPLTDFVLENTSTSSSHASARLASIAHLDFKGELTESVKLAGTSITYKRLQQHTKFWNCLKTDQAVIDTVPMWVNDAKVWPPCLVVGIMIAEEVDVDFSGASQRDKDGGIEFPIAKIAVTATGVPASPGIGDVEVNAGKTYSFASIFRAKATKSNIFALELQTIGVAKSSRWWNSKRKLILADDAPHFDEGRLMNEEGEGNDDKALPIVDDLELGGFSEDDYAQMSC